MRGRRATKGPLPLTTGAVSITILDFDKTPGARLSARTTGRNFSCHCLDFEEADGPGTLAFGSVTYDLQPPSFRGLAVDVITAFSFDD